MRLIDMSRSVRVGLPASLAVACLLSQGCSSGNGLQPPAVLLDTPMGVTPLYSPQPAQAMPGGMVAPPPGLEATLPVPAQMVSRDGSYAGTAEPLVTGGGLCIEARQVSGFRVKGNSVRFGGFRGTIAADNGLQMVYGRDWIIGQFEGATFQGQLDLGGGFDMMACTYMLNLQRVGA